VTSAPSAQSAATTSFSLRTLAAALIDSGSLVRAIPGRVRIVPAESFSPQMVPAIQDLLNGLTRALGLPELEVLSGPAALPAAEIAVSRRLALRRHDSTDVYAEPPEDVARQALAVFPGRPVVVRSYDGIPLRCWAVGSEDRPAVAVVNACGMPVGLAVKWMRALSSSYRVVTWESRGLFAAADGSGLGALTGYSLDAQSSDLLAVLDGFGIPHAHAIGLCGGAAIALAAAARSDRITSMSLWHGDYELMGDAPRTQHQQSISSMLAMAARGPRQAAGIYKMMSRPAALETMRKDIAHYLVHPYASPELVYRYGLLNGAIMSTDCRPLLATDQPALIVTSMSDATVHPAGSEFVAAHLPRAELRKMPEGDHLTLFDAGTELIDLAREFLGHYGGMTKTD
jgi:3-oxoadipate enol-lactonase